MMKLSRYALDKDYRFLVDSALGFHRSMPDEAYLKRVFHARMGRELKLDSPETFSEKLQWLKLHDHNPDYHIMVDKAEVKRYVADKLGEDYIVSTLGVYDDFDEIDFSKLPDRFVLKCTHDSGGLVICDDKSRFDSKKARKTLRFYLKRDYYSQWREWPYKGLPHRIIAEEYIDAPDGSLTDYKIHCFNGEPRLILVCKDRFAPTGMTEDFFTEQWEHLAVRRPQHPNAAAAPRQPEQLGELLRLSRILAEDIPFVRVDFYIVDHKVLFSELTFFPASGLTPFVPEEWDRTFGEWLDLEQSSCNN